MKSPCTSCKKRSSCTAVTADECPALANEIPPDIDKGLDSPHRKEMPSAALTDGWCDPGYRKDSHHKRASEPVEEDEHARWCQSVNDELGKGLVLLIDKLPPKRQDYIRAWLELADAGNMTPYHVIADRFKVTRQTVRTAVQKAILALREIAKTDLSKGLTLDRETGEVRPKRKVGRRNDIPWDKIGIEYVVGGDDVTQESLSKKYSVSVSNVARQSSLNNWDEKRRELRERSMRTAMVRVINEKASEIEAIDRRLKADFEQLERFTMSQLIAKDKNGKPILDEHGRPVPDYSLSPSDVSAIVKTLRAAQDGYYLIVGKPNQIQERRIVSDGLADGGPLAKILEKALTPGAVERLRDEYKRMRDAIDVTPEST